jgi:hypothetical protein
MGHQGKEDWLRDIEARQRNIVFPDTAQNEARFWRNLYSCKSSLTGPQWTGLLVLLVVLLGSLAAYFRLLWPDSDAPWWQKVIAEYGIYIAITAFFVLLLLVGNHRGRRKAASRKSSN